MKRIQKVVKLSVMYFVMIFTVLVSVFPILWIIMSAFKTNGEILSNPFSLPTKISFDAFFEVFTRYNFLKYTFNSFFVSSIAAIIALIIFSLAAYVIAKFDFKGKRFLYILFTLTLLVPAHTKAQPIFSLILNLDIYDTKMALILVYLSNGMALSIFILKAAFSILPISLSEAALIDGATFWQTFWKINMPLAKSGLATAGILMFLGNWNEYFYAMLLTSGPENRTLPLALAFFTETFSYNYTGMFAALTLVVLPGIIIYTLAQEQVQSSVASTGVKG